MPQQQIKDWFKKNKKKKNKNTTAMCFQKHPHDPDFTVKDLHWDYFLLKK